MRFALAVDVRAVGGAIPVRVDGRVEDLEGTRALDELHMPARAHQGLGWTDRARNFDFKACARASEARRIVFR